MSSTGKFVWYFLVILVVVGVVKKQPSALDDTKPAPTQVVPSGASVVQATPTPQPNSIEQVRLTVDFLRNHPNFMCSNGWEGPYGGVQDFSQYFLAILRGDLDTGDQRLFRVMQRIQNAVRLGCFK